MSPLCSVWVDVGTPKTSKLLEKLEAAIRAETRPAEEDRLKAQYVVHLARCGRLDEATAMLADLRQRHTGGNSPKTTPWINYADALVDRALGRGDSSLIKMRRAQATSAVAGLPDLQALSSAALAHIFWNREDLSAAVREVNEAFRLSDPSAHETRCRANFVVGEIFAVSRREDLAQPWFARGRQHAAEAGDDAFRSALMFNLAVCRLMMFRQATFDGEDAANHRASACQYVEASKNMDDFLGIPVDDLTPILQGRLHSLLGDPKLALLNYVGRVEDLNYISAKRQCADWLSDEAWCHARLGDLVSARRVAAEAEANIADETQMDDRAAVASRLALVYSALGEEDVAARHAAQAATLWAEYRKYQDRCVELCLTISIDDDV